MRTILVSLSVIALIAVNLAGFAMEQESVTVTVENQSDFAIYHFFLSPTEQEEWGIDQLRQHVIAPGESFNLNGIPCNDYDAKLVDEDGDECVLPQVEVCDVEVWEVTNDDLLECEGWS